MRLRQCGFRIDGGESERDLSGQERRARALTTDGEVGSLAHAFKLWLMIGRCDGWMGLMPDL